MITLPRIHACASATLTGAVIDRHDWEVRGTICRVGTVWEHVSDSNAIWAAAAGSLDYAPGYDTRIHIDADLAFVYRPVILEGPLTTYLVGWCDANMARKTRDWLNGIRGDLNLFFYPAIEVSAADVFVMWCMCVCTGAVTDGGAMCLDGSLQERGGSTSGSTS